jgi:DNA-binding CsgD family transcriptional regulator/tetratricopeptide (TPR) repeat protein
MIEPTTPQLEVALVGRQSELALLWSQFEAMLKGRLKLALLAGEPGIGKSRLLGALAAQAVQAGATVLWGGASEAEGMPPYLPFLEVLGAYIRVAPVDSLRTQTGPAASILATLLPELAFRLGELPLGYPLPPEQARLRLYEAVGAFLAAMATSGVVLIFDDLHWADAASLELLCYIARHQPAARLLIVGAYREGEAGGQLAFQRAIAELSRLQVLATVRVGSLPAVELAALAAGYLEAPLAPAASHLLYTQSEGNPFFAEELLRDWLETGVLIQVNQQWTLVESLSGPLPSSIVSAVHQRLTQLAPEVVEGLRTAAIIGRTFEVTFLAEVLSQEEEEVEEILQAAYQARLIRTERPGVFTFSHDTIRECLYSEVTAARRKRLHGFIGGALEAQSTQASAQLLADLAFHFTRSGDRVRGVAYAQSAAEQALKAFAPQEAMAYYQTALDLISSSTPQQMPPSELQGALLMGLSEAAVLAGAEQKAVAAFEAAQTWFRQRGASLATAQAAHGLGRALWRLESLPAAQSALETALNLLSLLPDPGPEQVHILVDLGSLLAVSLHRQAEGIAYGWQALALARQLENDHLVATASRTVGNLLVQRNDLRAGLPLLEQGLALAAMVDDPVEAAECCACLHLAYAWSGQMGRLPDLTRRWLEFAGRCHDPYQLRHIYSMQATGYIFEGRWLEAERMIVQAQAVVDRLASPEPTAFLDMTQGLLAYYRGDYAAAEALLAGAAATFRAIGPGALVWYLGWVGIVQAAQGKNELARACIVELETLMAALPVESMAVSEPLAHLAMIALTLDDRKRLARYYLQLLPFRNQFHDFIIDRLLGAIETIQGNWSAAQASLAVASVVARQADFKPELAYILIAQANLELAQGEPGSAGRARTLLGEALALFQQLNFTGEERRLQDRLCSLPVQSGPRSQTPFPASLSQREVEVLRLVAAGKSNRQIAAELALSQKTVANHLTHIFNKITADNRAAATAFAVRHGLV